MTLDFTEKKEALKKCKELKKQYPNESWAVIWSKGLYYVEDGNHPIRNWEQIILEL